MGLCEQLYITVLKEMYTVQASCFCFAPSVRLWSSKTESEMNSYAIHLKLTQSTILQYKIKLFKILGFSQGVRTRENNIYHSPLIEQTRNLRFGEAK